MEITTNNTEAKRFPSKAAADRASCEAYKLPGLETLCCMIPHPYFKTGWCVCDSTQANFLRK